MSRQLKISSRDREALGSVKEMLEADLEATPSLLFLCRSSGLNADKLKRGFKIMCGLPPVSYHRRLKMKEAMRLLRETEMSVVEIGWAVGYEYAGNFIKAFRREFGVRPGRVRE